MRRSSILVLFLSTILLLASKPEAFAFQIAVSPMKFEIPLGHKPVRRSLKVINQGKTPLEISVSIGHWDLDGKNKIRDIKPTSQSLDQWIVASPLKFKIPSGKARTLRFSIRPFTRPTVGEHRAMIYLDQGGPALKGANGVTFKFRLGVPVYANVGKPVRFGSIKGVVAKRTSIGFKIKNSGKFNVRFKGNFGVWKANAFPGGRLASRQLAQSGPAKSFIKPRSAANAGVLPSTPVLPGYHRTIPIPLKSRLRPGAYKIHLAGNLGDNPLHKTYSFTVY